MRQRSVRRAALLLSAVFLACAGLFAWLVGREPAQAPAALPPPAREDAGLFETYCGACHTADALRPGIAGMSATRRRELERFLDAHGDASASDDRLILDYLSAGSAPAPQ
jgi:hypothetical protein